MPALLRSLLAAAGMFAGASAGTLHATGRAPEAANATSRGDTTFLFNLPAQPAASALLAFSKQAKIEVLFSFDALRNERSTEVSGRFAPEEALHRLLRGTGFKAIRNGNEKFVVRPDDRPKGAIKGKVLTPDGAGASGVRIMILETHYSATTDHAGEFELGVSPGVYRLVARLDGFQPLQIARVEVEPQQVAEIAPQTLQAADDPAQLDPFLVKDRKTRRDPFDRSEAVPGPRAAGGNLDLARTENDALPFTIFNRDQIARSGVVNLNEFLQREILDSDAATRPPEQDGSLPTFAAGSTNLNLRGFGADQTIILVNGRRLPEALTNGSSTQTPDVNFIPLSLVQQVEVLPVSAASLYSGNAVGGIINIVLRPGVDAEATEVALTYTNAAASYDAPQSSASILHARSLLGGKLRVRFNASVTRATPPTETELKYRQQRRTPDLPLYASLYRATPNIRGADPIPAEDPSPFEEAEPPESSAGFDGDLALLVAPPPPPPPLFGPGTSSVTSVPPGADGTGGIAMFDGRHGVRNFDLFDAPGGLASSIDSIDYPYGRELRRTAYFGSAVFDATPWLQLGFDGTYTQTVLHRGHDVIAADLRLEAGSPFNPFGQEAIVSLNEVVPQLGQNHSEARLEFGSTVFSALFTLPSEWRVLLDTQYGRNIAKYRGLAGADYGRWQQLVDEGRYNPLRDTQVFRAPPEFEDVLVYRGGKGRFVTLGDYSTIDTALRITHHAVALPTGNGVVNFGADYRRNELARHRDERRFADGTLAVEPVQWAGRTLKRYSIFGELQGPLLRRDWLSRGVRSVNFDLAVRYIAANQSREENVAPTFALQAKFAGGLAFRGSVSTSSRFPTPQMSRLALAPPSSGTGTAGVELRHAYDPVQKHSYQMQEEEFINPDLRPEGALTQTAGLLFRHGQVHRFRAAIDFVDTRKINELIALDVQTILNLEHLFPDRVIRKPSLQRSNSRRRGAVTSVITGTINSAWRRSHNWNASLDYAWTECVGGTFEAYGRLLYYSRYDRLLLPGAGIVDELAQPQGAASGLLKYRAKFGAGWSNRAFGFGLDGHYFHSRVLPMVEWPSQGRDRIDPFWQCDAFVQGDVGRWAPWLPNGLRAQLRVNNVFSAQFPRYENDGSGAGVQVYGDWRGRVYSLSLTTAF